MVHAESRRTQRGKSNLRASAWTICPGSTTTFKCPGSWFVSIGRDDIRPSRPSGATRAGSDPDLRSRSDLRPPGAPADGDDPLKQRLTAADTVVHPLPFTSP